MSPKLFNQIKTVITTLTSLKIEVLAAKVNDDAVDFDIVNSSGKREEWGVLMEDLDKLDDIIETITSDI